MTETAQNPTEATTSSQATAAESATTETQATKQQATSDKTLLGTETETQAEGKTETATETKAETETKTETKTEGAPEKYEFKAPEGKELDPDLLTSFSDAAKDANLSQDSAQKLLDKMAPTLAARQVAQVEAIHKEWKDTSSSDKEFGGEKLKENMGVAKKALDAFDPIGKDQTTTPLRTLLEETGLGNHPEVIRLLYRAGKAISEDTFVSGHGGKSSEPDAASVLYPTMKQE